MKTIKAVELQMQAHADTAKEESTKHMRDAVDALKHGEDDNAMAHMLDAIRLFGRYQAFLDIAGDVVEFIGDDDGDDNE